MSKISAIQRAVLVAGSQSALARSLACTPQHVQKMCASGRVPANRVLAIELLTGVHRHELRPDLYPEAPPTMTQTIAEAGTQHSSTVGAVNLYSTQQTPP